MRNVLAAIVALQLSTASANAACRQALVFGLDISGSVDDAEYVLQRNGLADALVRQPVQDVLFAPGAAPVRIAVFEWSGSEDQRIILDWITLSDAQTLESAVSVIRTQSRPKSEPTTALGAAMLTGFAMLNTQSECWKRTLDISGDGPANTGPRPQDVTVFDNNPDMIVNGLVIGSDSQDGDDERVADIKELSAYFDANVIRGPGAFVETALGFVDYADAMERKILRELQSLATSNWHNQAAPDSQ